MKEETDINSSYRPLSNINFLNYNDSYNQSIHSRSKIIEHSDEYFSIKSEGTHNKRFSIEFDSNLHTITRNSTNDNILKNNSKSFPKFNTLNNFKDNNSNNNINTSFSSINNNKDYSINKTQNCYIKKNMKFLTTKKHFFIGPPDPLPKRTVMQKVRPRFGKMREYLILPEFIGQEPIIKIENNNNFALKNNFLNPPLEKQYEANLYINSSKMLTNLIYLKTPLNKDGYINIENLVNINKLNKLYEDDDDFYYEEYNENNIDINKNILKNDEHFDTKSIPNKKSLKKKNNIHYNTQNNINRQLSPYYKLKNKNDKTLIFESRFESGNLLAAFKTEEENNYQLYLQNDTNTTGYIQWFFFRVSNTTKKKKVKFNIINLLRSRCLYSLGLQIMVYSTLQAKKENIGWHRDCKNIIYYPNNLYIYNANNKQKRNLHTLFFEYEFLYDNDIVYFANCKPFFYSKLMKELNKYELDEEKYPFFGKKTIINTLGGNNVDMITLNSIYDIYNKGETLSILPKLLKKSLTNISNLEKNPKQNLKNIDYRKAIILFARQHPGETVGSFVIKGCLDFLMGNSDEAKKLRQIYLFKIIPMVNPDGVLVGNSRTSFAGCDLNRRWLNPNELIHPEIYMAKKIILKLAEQRNIAFIIDFHGHFGTYNALFYGNYKQNKKTCKLFPYICSKLSKIINFQQCVFSMPKYKRSTGRISLFNELENEDSDNIVGLETSFFGTSNNNPYGKIYFNTKLLKEIGRDVCLGILSYYYKFEKIEIFPDIFKNYEVDMREFESELIREVNEDEEENAEEEKSESEPSIDNLNEKQLMKLMPVKNKKRRKKSRKSRTRKFDKKNKNKNIIDIDIELYNPLKEVEKKMEEVKKKKVIRSAKKISIDCKKKISNFQFQNIISDPSVKDEYTQTEEKFFKMHWSYFVDEYKILSYKIDKKDENSMINISSNNGEKKQLLNLESDVFGNNLFRKSNNKLLIKNNILNYSGRNQIFNFRDKLINNSINFLKGSVIMNKNFKMNQSSKNYYKDMNNKNNNINNSPLNDEIARNKEKQNENNNIVYKRTPSGRHKSFPLRNVNHN